MKIKEELEQHRQQVFEKIANHLLQQGKRATMSDSTLRESCMYRTSDGLRCAVGCLIPDELYVPELEGMLWSAKPVRSTLEHAGIAVNDNVVRKILNVTQRTHDEFCVPEWRDELRALGDSLSLNTAFLGFSGTKS